MQLRDVLTEEEHADITASDNWAGAWIILFDWVVIVGVLWLTALFPNPITILLAIVILGGRQLALGIVVHETGHRSLFTSPAVNDFCGRWLSGYWVFTDKDAYMRNHLKHHQFAGTEGDPDLPNYQSFPVSPQSLRRKVTRDLTGQIGWRRIRSIGRSIINFRDLKPGNRKSLVSSLALNLTMLLTMTVLGYPWLFILWIMAFMTSHMLVTRIRQIAEHAAVPDHFDSDVRLNTRTTHISALERLLIAPHQVSFHLEHHLLASAPIYNLEKLHNLLRDKGFYDDVEFPRGYVDLLKQVTTA